MYVKRTCPQCGFDATEEITFSFREDFLMGMFERSGSFETEDRLTVFLYELMQDHMTPGAVEGLIAKPKRWQLFNGWLANHAADIARRLTGDSGWVEQQNEKPEAYTLVLTYCEKNGQYAIARWSEDVEQWVSCSMTVPVTCWRYLPDTPK